ncbi:F-box/kelch-repeat protein [Platanthera zijinensis]|uniref:F-box/kelch-repeat protein n=1 Tax=Platanthera zijinensis TaxID=2320716 RepID=A0AAP0B9H9_9ASPA
MDEKSPALNLPSVPLASACSKATRDDGNQLETYQHVSKSRRRRRRRDGSDRKQRLELYFRTHPLAAEGIEHQWPISVPREPKDFPTESNSQNARFQPPTGNPKISHHQVKLECVRSHSLLYLPQDLVIEIIFRLPAKSVGRFRCVSTAWLSIFTDPSFILTHTRRIAKSLAFHFIPRNLPLRKPTDPFPPPQNELFTVCIGKPNFRHNGYEAVSSCDGLICFRVKSSDCGRLYNYAAGVGATPCPGVSLKYVLNPLTGLRIDIPNNSVDRFGHRPGCQLYYHRWTGEYRLLHAHVSTYDNRLYAEVLSLGGAMNSWRQINATTYPGVFVQWTESVLVNDCFYWICRKVVQDNIILVFDISEEVFSCMEFPPDVLRCMSNFGLFGIEGKLCCWMVFSDENLIDNYRINIWVAVGGGEKWRSTYSLCLADEWRRPIYPSPCYTSIVAKFSLIFLRARTTARVLCPSSVPEKLPHTHDLALAIRNLSPRSRCNLPAQSARLFAATCRDLLPRSAVIYKPATCRLFAIPQSAIHFFLLRPAPQVVSPHSVRQPTLSPPAASCRCDLFCSPPVCSAFAQPPATCSASPPPSNQSAGPYLASASYSTDCLPAPCRYGLLRSPPARPLPPRFVASPPDL